MQPKAAMIGAVGLGGESVFPTADQLTAAYHTVFPNHLP